jgi:cytidine deaminase
MCRVFYKANQNVLKKANVLSFGFNRMGDVDGKKPGIHAEHDAINKLKPLVVKKRQISINLLVIRLSKNNKMGISKPCTHCIQTMRNLPQKKGYKIKKVYYSDDQGNIIKSSLNNLEKEEQHYSRFNRRNRH